MKIKFILLSCILLPLSLWGQNNLISSLEGCSASRSPFALTIKNAWTSATGLKVDNRYTTLTGDIDGDGNVEVLAADGAAGTNNTVYVFDGRNGTLSGQFNCPGIGLSTGYPSFSLGMAIFKRNATAKTTVFIAGRNGSIYLYEVNNSNRPLTFTLVWSKPVTTGTAIPVVADLDGDGNVEIIADKYIIDANTGAVKATLGLSGTTTYPLTNGQSFVLTADVDRDGLTELIVGSYVYKFSSGIPANPTPWKICPRYGVAREGANMAADINQDGNIDLVMVEGDGNVTVWTPLTGTEVGRFLFAANQYVSYPFVGDIDGVVSTGGKKYPEICINTVNKLFAYTFNGTSFSQKWAMPHSDLSGSTALTLFDFNLDGIVELVYRDQTKLHIFNGSGTTLVDATPPITCGSQTIVETPIIADVTGDGSADIIVTGNPSGSDYNAQGEVMVFEGAASKWASCPKVWNQQLYSNLLVNSDLTIPQTVLSLDLAFTQTCSDNAGNQIQYYNGGPMQAPLISEGSYCPVDLSSDVFVVSGKITIVNGTTVTIEVTFGNQGMASAPAGTPIRFYKDAISSGNILASASTTLGADLPVGQTITITKTITGLTPMPARFYVRALDDGTNFPAVGAYSDCDLSNNTKSFGTLELLKTVSSLTSCTNGTSIFTIKLVNNSDQTAPTTYNNIVLTDSLASGWEYISATPVNGIIGAYSPATHKLSWTIASIASGDSAKLIVMAKAITAGTINNNVWIESVNGTTMGRESIGAYVIVSEQQAPDAPTVTPAPANICLPATSVLLTATGAGATSYQWYKNDIAITRATSSTYSATSAGNYTVSYSNGTCISQMSAAVTVAVYSSMTAGAITTDQSICYNTVPALLTGALPTGGDGNYTYQWQSSADNTSWTDISGASLQHYAPEALTADTYYRRVVTGLCGTLNSNTILITVYANMTAGTISTDQSICYNTVPAQLTGTLPTGSDGNYTYQWQSSADNTSWTDISGATLQHYAPEALTADTYYRRVVTGLCGTLNSNTILITVYANMTAGTISTDQSICYNTVPAQLTGTLPTGGDGNYTYQWQSSADNSTWTNIATATASTYTPDALTTNTYFRRNVTSGACSILSSNSILITVIPAATEGLITANGTTICSGIPATLTATAAGIINPVFKWYSTPAGGTLLHVGANYTPVPNLTTTTTFYIGVSGDGYCENQNNDRKSVTITVDPRPTGANITGTTPATICSGLTATISATTNAASVEWYSDDQLTNRIGTDLSYTTPVLSVTTTYYVVAKNVNACIGLPAAAIPVIVTVNPRPTVANISATGATICEGSVATIDAATNAASVEWYSDAALTNRIGTDLSYTTPELYTTTSYYVVAKNAQGCIGLPAAAIMVTVTVNPRPTAANITNTIGDAICVGETATISATTDVASVRWYTDTTLTNMVGTALTYITPILHANTTYYVVARNAAGCRGLSTEAVSVMVTANSLPEAPIITGNSNVCENTQVTYSTQAGMLNYQWIVSGGAMVAGGGANDNSVTVNWSDLNEGSVSVNYQNASLCTAAEATTLNVTINNRPEQPEIIGNESVCLGATQIYTTLGGMSNYVWNVTNGIITGGGGSTNNYVTVQWPAATGTGNVSVNYTNSNGCTAGTATTASILINDILTPSIVGFETICEGTTETYTTEIGMTNYQWSMSGGSITSGGEATDNTITVLWNTVGSGSISVDYTGIGFCTPASGSTKAITVNARPTASNITNTTPATICAGETATINATTSAESVEWYSDAALTNRVSTDLSYTTPVLHTNTTYYVVAKNAAGCVASEAVAVTVTVNNRPTAANITSNTSVSICTGQQVIISATTNAASVEWYSDLELINKIGTDLSYTTPVLNTSTIYYVVAKNAAGCIGLPSEAVAVTVTVNDRPTAANITATMSDILCAGESATISATTDAASVEWYSDDQLTNRIGTGLAYTTPPLTATTTYYVIAKNTAGCTAVLSEAVSVIVIVYDRPTSANITSTAPASICTGETATISATTNAESVEWYSDALLTNEIGSNLFFTTPVLNTTTTYYVIAKNAEGCIGLPAAAVAVTVTVNSRPTAANISGTTPATICAGETATISATTNAASVEWYSDALLANKVGSNLSFTTPALNTTTTYYVVAKNAEGCIGLPAAAVAVTVTVNSRPAYVNMTASAPPICSGEIATITATTDADGVAWYTDAALTDRVGTDLSYTTPILYVSTYYYVAPKNANGCIGLPASSLRVQVIVKNRPTAANITSVTPATICAGETATISATTDAASVEWYSNAALTNRVGAALAFTTPALFTTTIYYVVAKNTGGCIGLASEARAVTVTVNDRPTAANITSITPATICAGETATISATTSAASVEWYSDAALTNRVGTDLSYTTPILNTTTTYYVVAKNAAGCIGLASEARAVTVTVNDRPTSANITGTTPATICAGETATISATTNAASVEWYSDAALTNRVGTDLSYTTPVLNTTTTYYVVAKNAAGCIGLPSEARAVMVTVNNRPTAGNITGTTPATICAGETATISATTNAASVEWYSDAALTNRVGTDLSYTTPVLNTTTTYYVVAKNAAGCIGLPSEARAVTVTVNDRPTTANITSVTPATICAGETATISATTDAASVEWYSDAALTNRVGTDLSYTTPILNTTTTYYVVAKNAAGCIGLPSEARAVTVTVNDRPTTANITSVTPATICAGETATISATTDAASVEWYSDAALTNRVGTDLSFTTPILNTTTTYYVIAKNVAGCIGLVSEARAVTVIVNDRPTAANITGITPATICAGETATISATTDAASVEWYSDAALTNRVGTDLSYTTPILNTTTTYYVVAKNAAGCIGLPSEARAVTVTVNDRPTTANITSVTPATICAGETATISATTDAASVEWYSDAALTNRVGTDLSFTTPILNTTTTYYVIAKNVAGCIGLVSEARAVTVIVNDRPTAANITGITPATICAGETATISATTNAASVEWYSDAALTNRVGTDLSYTTPVLNTTTTYYVVAKNANGCIAVVSEARAVMVTVNDRPTAANITSTTPATICAGETATISATTSAASIEWYSDAALTNRVGTDLSYTTPVLNTTTTYYAVAKNANGCIAVVSEARAVTVTVNNRPTAGNITGTTPATICAGETATISATTNAASVEWYSDAALTNRVGTDLSYTTPVLNTTTTYYVVAKNAAGCIGLPSEARAVTVTVNDRPTTANITSVTPATICAGETATISATTDAASVEWYSDAALTNRVGTDLSYTTPILNTTTTYYVIAKNVAGCIGLVSEVRAVTVTVNDRPTAANITSITPATICAGETATISATTDAASVEWYSDVALTNRVGTDLSYTTPILNTTTTYYVVAKNANGCIAVVSEARAVTVTVNNLPTAANITGTTPATICAGETATISATTNAESVEWYSDAALTNRVGTDLSYTTPVLNTTTTYYVVAKNANGCIAVVSEARAVTVTVNDRPTAANITSITPATICAGETATISATTSAASVEWYSDALLTNKIGSDASFTTPALNTTTTYYVVAKNANGCLAVASEATAVMVTVNDRPTAANITSVTPATICAGETATISATTNAASVEWHSDALLTDKVGTDFSFTTPILNTTTTYYVVAKNANGCIAISSEARAVTVTVNDRPTTANITSITPATICAGETATISATTNAASVEWYSDAALTNRIGTDLLYTTPVLLVTTTYYVVAKNANGCIAISSEATAVSVTVSTKPNITSIGSVPALCPGETLTVQVTVNSNSPIIGYTWLLNDQAITGQNTETLHYIVKPEDNEKLLTVEVANICGTITSQAQTVVVYQHEMSIVIPFETCGTQTVDITNASHYSGISNMSTANFYQDAACKIPLNTPTVVGVGTYYIVNTNSHGCIDTLATNVLLGGATPPALRSQLFEYCQQEGTATINVMPDAGYSLLWYNTATGGTATATPIVDLNVAGTSTYYVSQTSSTGCVSTQATITVTVNPAIKLTITDDAQVNKKMIGTPVNIKVTPSDLASYSFTYNRNTVTQSAATFSIYQWQAKSANVVHVSADNGAGCVSNADYSFIGPEYDLPNIITPDGTSNNALLKGYDLEVYNRWGSQLYKGTDGWKGTYKGARVSSGTYYYIVHVPLPDGSQMTLKYYVFVKE